MNMFGLLFFCLFAFLTVATGNAFYMETMGTGGLFLAMMFGIIALAIFFGLAGFNYSCGLEGPQFEPGEKGVVVAIYPDTHRDDTVQLLVIRVFDSFRNESKDVQISSRQFEDGVISDFANKVAVGTAVVKTTGRIALVHDTEKQPSA